MNRRVLTVLLFGFGAAAVAAAGSQNVNVRTHDGIPARCSDVDVSIDGWPAARDEQALTVAPPPGTPLVIRAAANSGVSVEGTDRRDVLVVACKAARTRDAIEAIRVTATNSLVTAAGPEDGSWVAYLLVQVPRSSVLELTAGNGPLSLQGAAGKVMARSENGPISIEDCPGSIDARAQNGPIQVSGSGGDVRMRTQNGPISVRLTGNGWDGTGLDARTVNGPVSLKIPNGYLSGAVVESAGDSPFRCKGSACDRARHNWDDDGQRVELGGGTPAVHVSTVNGPVTVSSTDED